MCVIYFSPGLDEHLSPRSSVSVETHLCPRMWLLQRWHRKEHLYMGLVVSLACVFSICNLFPIVGLQYVAAR